MFQVVFECCFGPQIEAQGIFWTKNSPGQRPTRRVRFCAQKGRVSVSVKTLPPMGPVGAQGSERPRAKSPYPRKIYGGPPRSREDPEASCRLSGSKWLRGFSKAPWKSFGNPRDSRDFFGFRGVSTIFRASPPPPPQSGRFVIIDFLVF